MSSNSKLQYCEKCGKVIAVSQKICYMCDFFSKSYLGDNVPVTLEELTKQFLTENEWLPTKPEELLKELIKFIDTRNYQVTISLKKD